jgi:hypothetical protein
MERKEQEPSGESPQAAEGGNNQLSEKKRAIVALTRILGSGPLDEESLQLLEQLANCIQCPQTEISREAESVKQVAVQQVVTVEEESTETKPAEAPTGEPSSSGDPGHNTEEGVILGSLPTMPTDRWVCKVPSCTGSSTASRTVNVSTKWNRKKGSGWQICTVSAWDV